ncbi:hypothetical protein L917_20214, partial [Phytophthora nicotianae]
RKRRSNGVKARTLISQMTISTIELGALRPILRRYCRQ